MPAARSSIAQSVEQVTVNHRVVGSSPTRGATSARCSGPTRLAANAAGRLRFRAAGTFARVGAARLLRSPGRLRHGRPRRRGALGRVPTRRRQAAHDAGAALHREARRVHCRRRGTPVARVRGIAAPLRRRRRPRRGRVVPHSQQSQAAMPWTGSCGSDGVRAPPARTWQAAAAGIGGISGGEGGIRTPVDLAAQPVFETGPFSHSGTSPRGAGAGTRTAECRVASCRSAPALQPPSRRPAGHREPASREARRSAAWTAGWGDADDLGRTGGFTNARRRVPGRAVALGLADCNPLHRVSRALLAAGPLLSGLGVLCVLCGSSLSQQQQQQNNHRGHRDHRAEQTEGRQQGDRQLHCASGGVAFRGADS
jgi:hypothetical protein